MSDGDKTSTPMWKFEGWFQSGVAKIAKSVFDHLDYKLKPRVFLLGIPEAQEADTAPVCLQPMDECGYKPEFFSEVMNLARQIEVEEEERKPGRREPVKAEELKVSSESIRQAIEQTLNKAGEVAGVISYCSLPITVGGYKVCCVLQLDAGACSWHYALTAKKLLSTRFVRSLIDATAVEFLRVCARVLRDPQAGADFNDTLGREPEEILRLGGREFMFRATDDAGGASHQAFDAINELSWKAHEGEVAGGEIHFIHWDEHYLDMLVEFKHPPELQDIGAARKVIEMAKAKRLVGSNDEGLYLIADGHSIHGIGRLKELEDEYDRYGDIFIVRFTGYYRWELIHREGGVMMRVINGVPSSLPLDPIDRKKFKDHVRRRFTKSAADEGALWNLVNIATRQRHGTMIVISGDAEKEADRLEDQSTVFQEPLPLSPEILLMLSSIDGALLVDLSGTCHAAGVILDGTAMKGKGTRSRGSRYNSAIGYINAADAKGSECLIVVVSEDGIINMMPDLPERISRSEIPAHLERLRAAVVPEIVDAGEYYKTLNWFNAHHIYLSQEVCDELNEIKNETKPRLEKQQGYSRTPADFQVSEEMSDEYFLEEGEP